MTERRCARSTLSRRAVLALAASVAPVAAGVRAQPSGAWRRVDEIRALVGEAEPMPRGVMLDLPFLSESGSAVPVAVAVDEAVTGGAALRTLHLFAPGNPFPDIAAFHFTPLCGTPAVETRIRLNASQTVIAVALFDDGTVRLAERDVRVTVSGCFTNADTYASTNLFRTRFRSPERLAPGKSGAVLTIIQHPMESGLRRTSEGVRQPKRLIERFEAQLDDDMVFAADLHHSVASNPFIKFHIAPRRSGRLRFLWREDTGRIVEAETRIDIG